ncbi:MAG: DUF493 domain-containing protein [Gammaproteobacteria bacterium]|jgi:uncharacterized protein
MPDSRDSLIEYPCDFPIKIAGAAIPEFEQRVLEIVQRHAPEVGAKDLGRRLSRTGRYLSLTVTVRAYSREQLDALYQDLTACELTQWVL